MRLHGLLLGFLLVGSPVLANRSRATLDFVGQSITTGNRVHIRLSLQDGRVAYFGKPALGTMGPNGRLDRNIASMTGEITAIEKRPDGIAYSLNLANFRNKVAGYSGGYHNPIVSKPYLSSAKLLVRGDGTAAWELRTDYGNVTRSEQVNLWRLSK